MGCEAKALQLPCWTRAKYRRARFGREFDEPIAQSNGHDVPMT
jgi:hypothetical protein